MILKPRPDDDEFLEFDAVAPITLIQVGNPFAFPVERFEMHPEMTKCGEKFFYPPLFCLMVSHVMFCQGSLDPGR